MLRSGKVEGHSPSYYPSSGGCSEKLDVFVGQVDASKAHGIHGLDYEDEDIRVHVMSREEAYQKVLQGEIENGASIIAVTVVGIEPRSFTSRLAKRVNGVFGNETNLSR